MSLATDSPSPDPSSPTTQPPQPESSSPIVNPMPAAEANPNGPRGSASNDVKPTAAGPDEASGDFQDLRGSTGAPSQDGVAAEEQTGDVVAKKKRKKRKKAGTSMTKSRGTGFEEFYADPPMTPEEASEEQAIYSENQPFAARIEECLNRFRARRRLQGDLVRYFDEYLFLGGIDASQRAFQGVGPKEYAAATADEKQQLSNVYGIHCSSDNPKYYNPSKPEHWSVDFSAVVAGYLSEGIPYLTWTRRSAEVEMQRAIDVVANFLRYLLQHDVCNEYEDDIANALALCERGKEELPLVHGVIEKLPCLFNQATAEVAKSGTNIMQGDDPPTDAEAMFRFGLSFFGPRDACTKVESLKVIRTVSEEPCSLEIISIHPPDERTVRLTRIFGVTTEVRDAIKAGVIRCKHVHIRDELCRGDAEPELPDRIEVLVIQSSILDFLRPGFIIRVTLGELNIGLKYMVNLPEILPSFYRFLPQSLMLKYKVPAPNPRPAPSVLGSVEEDYQDQDQEAKD